MVLPEGGKASEENEEHEQWVSGLVLGRAQRKDGVRWFNAISATLWSSAASESRGKQFFIAVRHLLIPFQFFLIACLFFAKQN